MTPPRSHAAPRGLAACALLAAALPARAAAQAGAAADEAIKQYSVPESPAFSFLDASPAKITRPTAPRDLVTSLVNAIDADGRVRQGLAIEFQPSAVFRLPVSLGQYQARGLRYVAHNAQLSLGSVRASGDAAATDVAYGLRLTLLDRGDPMADRAFTGRLVAALAACARGTGVPPLPSGRTPPAAGATARPASDTGLAGRVARLEQRLRRTEDSATAAVAEARQPECNRRAIAALNKAYADSNWNRLHVALSYAGGNRTGGLVSLNRSELGHRLWLVAGVPATRFGQLLGYARLSNVRGDLATPRTRAFSYGARGVVGKPTFNGFAEVVGERRDRPPAGVGRNATSWSGGAELRVAEQLWLATGFGKAGDVKGGPTLMIANLRWGLSDKARLAPR